MKWRSLIFVAFLPLLFWWQPASHHHKPMPQPTPTATATATPTTGMHLVLDDEFSGSSLNTTTWYDCPQPCTAPNHELELYTSANVSEHDGMLDLEALHQSLDGHSYTSGKIMSNQSWTYGYFEARVELPQYQGFWPAFWLLADNGPAEIDIMETTDTTYLDDMSDHPFVHGKLLTLDQQSPLLPGWHTLGLDWEPTGMTFSIDGLAMFSVTNPQDIPSTPLFLILNLAVGGDWPGPPDASTPFPSDMLVDYVHVWQH